MVRSELIHSTSVAPGSAIFRELPGPGSSDRAWGMLILTSACKRTSQLQKGRKLQFRADFFNLFNHVNFNAPSTFIPGGGLINTSQDARQMQFALKFYF